MSPGGHRGALVFTASTVAALGLVFACAERDGHSNTEDAGYSPDAGDLPESDSAGVDASREAGSVVPEGGDCSADGFCLVPLPSRQPLASISASSMDDAWAVGPEAVLRWDGMSWKTVYGGLNPRFFGVAVAKRDDVWILGERLLVRYSGRDGQAPAFRAYPGLSRAAAKETTSFWLAAASEELWIATIDPDPLASVGYRYREDSNGHLVESRISDAPLNFPWSSRAFAVRAIFGFGPNDVYVGGEWCDDDESCLLQPYWPVTNHRGAIAHYDGTSWSMVTLLDREQRVSAMVGMTATDGSRQLWIWTGFAGYPSSSVRLLPVRPDGGLDAPVFAQPMAKHPSYFPPYPADPFDNWSSGCNRVLGSVATPGAAWLSDVCSLYRWNGTGLEATTTAVNGLPVGSVTGIWAANADEAWIVGERGRPSIEFPPVGFAARRMRRSTP